VDEKCKGKDKALIDYPFCPAGLYLEDLLQSTEALTTRVQFSLTYQ